MEGLTYKEFSTLAQQMYCKGGCTFAECWDKSNFDQWVKLFGPITRDDALEMFRQEHENAVSRLKAKMGY